MDERNVFGNELGFDFKRGNNGKNDCTCKSYRAFAQI